VSSYIDRGKLNLKRALLLYILSLEMASVAAGGDAKKRLHGLGDEDLHAASPSAEHDRLGPQDGAETVGQARAAPRDRLEVVVLDHLEQMLHHQHATTLLC
jgi:hypothetical protein